jgi:uncharacterized protein (DUF849 family)
MEDALDYLPGRPTTGNAELVERIAGFAAGLGRPLATPAQTRAMLGL